MRKHSSIDHNGLDQHTDICACGILPVSRVADVKIMIFIRAPTAAKSRILSDQE